MGKTMVILMGLQGSGKSTFYQVYLEKDFLHVNLDTLKTRRREADLIEMCIEKSADFAVDNTNPTRAERARYIPLAKAAGYRVVGYFMESKLRVCMERNRLRSGKACVPDKAIAATSNRLELPSYNEGFDELYFVKNGGETMEVSPWGEHYEF